MFKTVLNYFINTQLFLATCASFFVAGLHKNWIALPLFTIAVFWSIIGVYNFHKWYKFKSHKLDSKSTIWILNNEKTVKIFAVVGLLFGGISFTKLTFNQPLILILIICFFLLSVFYVVLKWREIPFVKALIVSISWTFVLVFLPNLLQLTFNHELLFYIPIFYALSIFSDIKDIEVDDKQLVTLPQVIGVKFSFLIALFTLQISFALLTLSVPHKLFLLVTSFIWIAYIYSNYKNQKEFRIELADAIMFLFGISFILV